MKAKAFICFLLGWLVPGLGHFAQKKLLKGLVFFIGIAGMTSLGLIMGGKIYPLQAQNPLTLLAFFSDVGNGLMYVLSLFLPVGTGALKNVTFEFGTAYLAGAGLLNYLIALDAFDIALGKKK